MRRDHRSSGKAAHTGTARTELIGLLINGVAFLASGVGAITMARRFVWADILAVLYVATGAIALLTVLTVLLRREPSNVSKLRQRLVSSYLEAIGSSRLAPTHSQEHARA